MFVETVDPVSWPSYDGDPRNSCSGRRGRATDAHGLHAELMASGAPLRNSDGEFDRHVLACLLAIAFEEEGREGVEPFEALGVSRLWMTKILADWFPKFSRVHWSTNTPMRDADMEEDLLAALLEGHLVGFDAEVALGHPSEITVDLRAVLPRVIARRALRPDHLWQDLGLFDRGELNRLLARHFPTLHAGNTGNMRWKKYFYRRLCEAEGFSLCTAPSCSVCTDFTSCFGEEDGQSRLANVRRATDLGEADRFGRTTSAADAGPGPGSPNL